MVANARPGTWEEQMGGSGVRVLFGYVGSLRTTLVTGDCVGKKRRRRKGERRRKSREEEEGGRREIEKEKGRDTQRDRETHQEMAWKKKRSLFLCSV